MAAVKDIESDDDLDEDDDDDFTAPAKKVQKQGSGSSSKATAAAKPAGRTASNAQAPKARPASGGSRPGSAGDSRRAAAEKPKSRPLVASTQKVSWAMQRGLCSVAWPMFNICLCLLYDCQGAT